MNLRRVTRTHALPLIVSLLLACGASAPVRAAEGTEIPGTPLPPSGKVASEVGGSVYDLVYSAEIPAASVLVVSLRGEPGAELGLYLFDQGASSILTALPLASSAKSGGVQSISLRFIRASRVFINVNGRNSDRPYKFTMLASVLRDETPPIIASAVANARSQSSRVCVAVRATDPISGITGITLNDELGGGDTNWVDFAGSGVHCTALAAGDGPRGLIVRTRNGVDLTSAAYQLATVIDDALPALTSVSPAGDLLLAPRGAISWRFDNPITTVASLGSAVSVFNQTGRVINGTVTRSANRRKVTWTPTGNIPAGSVLLASLGAVRDGAGNTLDFTDTRVITRKNSTWLRIAPLATASSPRVRISAPASMVGATIIVEEKSSRGWTTLRSVTLTATTISLAINVDVGSTVRAMFAGSDRLAPSASAKLIVK